MKKLLIFLTTILTINSYSQISFEKGYYIDNSDQKIDCFIKNKDWGKNPNDFKYKISENDNIKTIGIDSVKEFGIYNISKYIRRTVNIDESGENIDELSYDKNPVFIEKQLFLKVLVEGKANLYQGGNLNKYFYNVDNSTIEQLIFKSYRKNPEEIADNNLFRKQLWDNLKCPAIKNDLLKLDYEENSLITIFCEDNKCTNSDFINYKTIQQPRDIFNLTLRPRLNDSSLTIQNPAPGYGEIDFGKKIGFGFGIEVEYVLPFNKNKWALLLEPTYQSFKGENTKFSSLIGAPSTTEINYTSIEIPVGIRHYFFLNNNSKVFINASFVYDLSLDSKIEFKRQNNSIYSSLEYGYSSNIAFGIGYKLYKNYSMEMRFQTRNTLAASYSSWSSDYDTLSIIFGYTIF